MKTKTPGIVLIIIGIIMLAYSGFSYVTTEKVVDLGPIQINKEKNHSFNWPPIVGAVVFIGGILFLVIPNRGQSN